MKKISLKNLNLKEVEQLSRAQLKNVLGGFNGGTTTESESEACIAAINCGTVQDPNNISCGCEKGGSCSSTPNSVTCKCNGEEETTSTCSD